MGAKHVPEMVTELVRLATEGENEATRIAAIKEVFDRAIGKAAQPVETEVKFGIRLSYSGFWTPTMGSLDRSHYGRMPLRWWI
jgi:hypothetical protein